MFLESLVYFGTYNLKKLKQEHDGDHIRFQLHLNLII